MGKPISPELLAKYIEAQSNPRIKAKIKVCRCAANIKKNYKLIDQYRCYNSSIADSIAHTLEQEITYLQSVQESSLRQYNRLCIEQNIQDPINL